ncbi:hypothetical protein [Amycolatopsis taiwanensis]|uniref:Uncharacterized protein n=1 Tax=Amycolatopsis taiwanensis TaxID=342230 RepID=A0A9W6RCP9_9PSEU|nr:hypothetical protein [Amycolatopsis taiwanensis]GLY71672.1 hypothetical protein Atai01_82910 [Amycolatopsis taiwanensis]
MMTMVETDVIGRVWRQPRRTKDRKAALRYGRSPHNRYRGHWSLMETRAFQHDRFIADSLRDDDTDLHLPPHERPGLIQLAALAAGPLPGGVLLESLNALGDDPLARAVLGRFLQTKTEDEGDPPIWYGERWRAADKVSVRQVKAKDIAFWEMEAGRNAVEIELGAFTQAIQQQMLEMIGHSDDGLHIVLYLGSGPFRDENLARMQYHRLTEGHSDTKILRHLETYGYTNPNGTVGRWYPKLLNTLRSNGPR